MTARPLPPLPALMAISVEERDSPTYHYEGRFRRSEKHICFQYTLSGKGVFKDAKGTHWVPPGYGFLWELGDPTTAYYYPPDAKVPWKYIFIKFEGDMPTKIVRGMVERYGHIFPLDMNSAVLRRLSSYSAYDGALIRITPYEGAAIIMDLLNTIGANMERRTFANAPVGRLVTRACTIFDTRFTENVRVNLVASELGVSHAHLTRVFKAELNCAPHRYLNKLRVFAACKLLKDSTLSCKEICSRAGEMTPQHFVRLFRKELNMTPGQFRKTGSLPHLGTPSSV